MAGGVARDFPDAPHFTLKQPIIDQQFCDKDGNNCERKSFCAEYIKGEDQKWVWKMNHPLKTCHGTFAINSAEYVDAKAYVRDVKLWVDDTVAKLNACSK